MRTTPTAARTQPDLGWILGVLLRAYQASVVSRLGDIPHGPRGYQTLAAVVHGDQPSQLALAAHLGIDRTVMTYLIDDLVEAGLVRREPDPADRRRRKVVPTENGVATFRTEEQRVRTAEEELLGMLGADDRAALRTLLLRVADGVRHIDRDTDPCDVAEEMLAEGPRPA